MGLSENETWIKAAQSELDGADPLEKLASYKGNIRIDPYYSISEDRPTYSLPASDSWLGARSWNNAVTVMVDDDTHANKVALNYLATGADGIVFHLNSTPRLSTLLAEIQLEYCAVFFTGSITKEFITSLITYVRETGQRNLTGGLYYKSVDEIIAVEHNFQSFRTSGLIFNATKESSEVSLANLLVQFVKHFSTCRNVPREFDNCAVLIDNSTDFFLEIARLKALRILWNGLRQAYGAGSSDLYIHSRTSPWLSENFQPHGNMIAATTRSLSSILGGCDALTAEGENLGDNASNRIARNISLVLRDESHVSKVADATSGSYYIDQLVADLSEKAWTEFQKIAK